MTSSIQKLIADQKRSDRQANEFNTVCPCGKKRVSAGCYLSIRTSTPSHGRVTIYHCSKECVGETRKKLCALLDVML